MTTAERSLAARFAAGESEAIRELHAAYAGAVSTVARSVLGSSDLIADAVQETFVRAWRASSSFDPGRELAPWLYTIARRTSVDVLRRERRPTTGGHAPEVDVAVDGPSLDRMWVAFEVRRALDGLPADERDIVRLSHLDGVPHSEIAERLGIPVGTVKSRSARAHRRLAAALSHVVTP